MSHTIVPGDVVRYSSVACYTGVPYEIYALVLAIEDYCISTVVISESTNDALDERDLIPELCVVTAHITLPSYPSKDQALLHQILDQARGMLST